MPLALFALAVGAFGIGTTEFVIVGLLPDLAAEFGVSVPTAGLLVSGYALTVVVGAPLLTIAGARLPRKTMLLALMATFVAGNVACAVAPSFGLLMAGRVLTALCHGAFFGIGSVVAANVVAPDKKARAIALMFTGLTLANVLGVPLGTALGQQAGWRSTFWVVAALGVVGLVSLAILVPRQPVEEANLWRRELQVFRDFQVWLVLAMTALGFAGVFASLTYIAPMMTEVAGYSEGAVTWLLVLFGAGLFIGNLGGGRAADRRLMPSLYVILSALVVVLAVFVVTAHWPVPAAITIFLFGIAGFATVPPLQARIMQKAASAPALASAANISAFNLGNAIGAWLGGLAIGAGLGYTAPNGVGALLALSGLVVVAVSDRLDRRRSGSAAGQPAGAGAR